ncbi:MAG: endonuclease domain-containing protein [Anaerolineae bacterium]|nr:endonuclease domain-containing protein [Anaerolineae bacterium]
MGKERVDPTTLARARVLRHAMTPQERKLWHALCRKQLYGLRFRRQHPFPPYILDFYCFSHRLVIELDGGQHGEPAHAAYDQQRTAWLEAQGLRVLRFWNHEVDTNLEGVLATIAGACGIEGDPP